MNNYLCTILIFDFHYCQTPGQVFRLGVDFVLLLSLEEQEQEEQEPLTKIYQKGV